METIKGLADSAAGLAVTALFLIIYFPGGTIFMALMCNTSKLDGWDWVLSVIIPGYGIGAVLLSSAC